MYRIFLSTYTRQSQMRSKWSEQVGKQHPSTVSSSVPVPPSLQNYRRKPFPTQVAFVYVFIIRRVTGGCVSKTAGVERGEESFILHQG